MGWATTAALHVEPCLAAFCVPGHRWIDADCRPGPAPAHQSDRGVRTRGRPPPLASHSLHLPKPADTVEDEPPLNGWRLQLDGRLVGLNRLLTSVQASEEVGPGDVELRPLLQLGVMRDGVEDDEAGRRSLRHGDRDGAVRLDDGGRLIADQLSVEQRDLAPVGRGRRRGARVAGGDGGVQLVRARPAGPQGLLQDRLALCDQLTVPPEAVLVLEQYEVPGRVEPGLSTGVGHKSSASRPAASGSSGRSSRSARASRMAASHSSPRTSVAPPLAMCPSVNTRKITLSTAGSRSRTCWPVGVLNRMPASRILALPRTRRLAMVPSGTRKAAAISDVARPQTHRSVSAIRVAESSAGWQHRKTRARSSSGLAAVGSA